jgi:Ni,Fe-hydrogenase III component G
MNREENIKTELVQKCGVPEDKCVVRSARRIFVETDSANVAKILAYAHDTLKFTILCTITGLDAGSVYQVIYHIAHEDGIVVSLKLIVPKDNAVIKSVIPLYNGAINYEREIVDLLGIAVEGLPPGPRYPLPDDWPEGQYPLRKDWKPEMLSGNKPCGSPQTEAEKGA